MSINPMLMEEPLKSFTAKVRPGGGIYELNVYRNGNISFYITNNKVDYPSFKKILTQEMPGKYKGTVALKKTNNSGKTVIEKLGSLLDNYFIAPPPPPTGFRNFSKLVPDKTIQVQTLIYLEFSNNSTNIYFTHKGIRIIDKIPTPYLFEYIKGETLKYNIKTNTYESIKPIKLPVNLSLPIYEYFGKVQMVLSQANRQIFDQHCMKAREISNNNKEFNNSPPSYNNN